MFVLEGWYQLLNHMTAIFRLPVLVSTKDDNSIVRWIRTIDPDNLANDLPTNA